MKIRITGLPKSKKTPSLYGFGGNLGTNGADFTDGLTYFNVPTRHETNPNGGIPQGMASDGQPNLVEGKEEDKKGEGGEIKWNLQDYIFSDRLTPSQDLIKKWKLPENFLDYTYADVVRKSPVIKEAEERPNDPKSQDTVDRFLADVAEDQELTKKQKEAAKMQEQLSQMSDDELMALGAQMSQEEELQRQQQMEQLMQQPDDYGNLAQNAQQENIQSAALINDMAQQQGMVQPQMMGAEGGALFAEGGQPEVMDQMPQEEPQEQQPMMNMEPQQQMMPQQPMQEPIPQAPQEEQPERKPTEEMSTKELNEALDEIIEYARENKDKQLLREAKKVKRSSTREEKEAFVDDTFEEMEMEQQEQAEQAQQEALQEQPVMMAEGGEMPEEEPQKDIQVEQPQQNQNGEQLIQQLLRIGDQLGYGKDSEYTPQEVEDLLNKASQDGIDVSSLQSQSSEELATMFTQLLKQVNNQEEVVQPEAPQEPQENQFGDGGKTPRYNRETGTIILNLNNDNNVNKQEEVAAEPVITVNEGDPKVEQEKQMQEKVVVLPETEVVAQKPRRVLSPQQFFARLPYNNDDIFGNTRALIESTGKKPSEITSRELAQKALEAEEKKREYQTLERKRAYLQYLLGDNNLIANYITDGGTLDVEPSVDDNLFLSGGQLRKAKRWARHNDIVYKDERELEKLWSAHNNAIKKWGKSYENLSKEDQEVARRINKNIDSSNLKQGIIQQRTEDFLNKNAKGYKVADAIKMYPENLFTTTRPENWDYSKNGESEGGWDFSTLYGNDGQVILHSNDQMGNPVHSNGNETIGVTYNGYNDYAAEHNGNYRYNGEDVSKEKLRELTQASKDAFVEQIKQEIKNGQGRAEALSMLYRLGAGTNKNGDNLYFNIKNGETPTLESLKPNWEKLYRKHSTSGAVAQNHGWFKELPRKQTIYRLKGEDGKYTEVYGDNPILYGDFYDVSYNSNDSKDGVDYYDLTPKNTNRNLVTVGDVTYELPDDFNQEAFKKGRQEVTPLGPGATNTDQYYDFVGGPSSTGEGQNGTVERPYPFTSILKFLPFLNFPYLEDYSGYNEMVNATNGIKYIDAPDHREYLKYIPADQLYRINQAQMMGAAANRGIAGLANRNQGSLMANLALQNAKNREMLGQIGIDIEKENWERNKDVVTQHNQVDLTADQLQLDADKANMSNNPIIVDSRHKAGIQRDLINRANNESLSQWQANMAEMANKQALNDEQWYWYGRYLDSGAAAPGEDVYFGRGKKVATPPFRKSGGSLTIRRKRRNRLS